MPEDKKGDEGKGNPPAPAQQRRQGGVQERQAAAQEAKATEEKHLDGYLTEIVEVSVSRTGIYGEIKQAMCKILEGKDKGRVIRRNIAGKIRVGDMLRLPDTSREDKPIRAR
ncbi:MAG: hypothetical protein KGH67_05720 [Candidatus Micrarchaeota archaeon]|nr:hypothetical protein [Candidatus Micrarchaeota archaeon]